MALFHLLYPKSGLQICRLRFLIARSRCCLSLPNCDNDNPNQLNKEAVEEETSIVAVEPIVEESPKKKSDFVSTATFIRNEIAAYGASNKHKTLTDLFRDGQTETTAENKGLKPEPTIADIILSCAKHSDTESECLSHSNDPLQCEPEIDSQDSNSKEFPPNNCKKNLQESSSPSNGTQKVLDLKDCHTKSANGRAEGEVDYKTRSFAAFTHQPMNQSSNEPRTEDADKLSVISGLIDFMRVTEDPEPSNSSSKVDVAKENSFDTNFQRSDPTKKTHFAREEAGENKAVTGEELQRSDPTKKTHFAREESGENKVGAGKESEENKVLLRFMPSHVSESNIFQHFKICGEISKVEIPYAEGPLFKSGYIYFKTREGLKNAVKKSGLIVGGGTVTVEPADSTKKRTVKKTPIPRLIGDPDTPTALVKNPTRTIKIESLNREISSHHIEEALDFCETNVSGYFMGSSDSVAYVEFESEIGKERALAKQSINVLGRRLVMLRIDSPRTTVVRIIGRHKLKTKNILSECRSLGNVVASFSRTPGMLDVHFDLAEWPNMLKIINRLNGMEIDGARVQAEPAPVFPPDVLLALWQDPDERKHLRTTMQALLHKLAGKSMDTSRLAVLQNVFVDDI